MSAFGPSEIIATLVERMQGRNEIDDRSLEAVQTFQGIKRWIPQAISPFLDLHSVMSVAIPTEDLIDENDKKNFEQIMKLHPRFPELILAFREEAEAYDDFVAMMAEAFGNARAQDTNSTHYTVPTFIPLDPLVDVVQPPITNDKSA